MSWLTKDEINLIVKTDDRVEKIIEEARKTGFNPELVILAASIGFCLGTKATCQEIAEFV